MSDEVEIKDLTSAINNLIPALSAMGREAGKAGKSTSEFGGKVGSSSTSFYKYEAILRDISDGMYDLDAAQKKAIQTSSGLRSMVDRSTAAFVSGDDVLDKRVEGLKASIKAEKEFKVSMEKSAQAQKVLNKATQTSFEKFKKLKSGAKSAGQDVKKFYAFFGAGSLTLKNAKDHVVKFNQSMFDMDRTFKASGRGLQDLNTALSLVADNTTFSRQQFTDFSTAVAQGYTGIVPTTTAIAGLAMTLQNQFGPNVERSQEVMKNLLDLFGKFPPALDQIMRVQDVMARIKTGDSGAKDELKVLQTTLSLYAQNSGASKKQRQEILQLTTATTAEQKKQLGVNTALKKVEQTSADAILKMGEQIAPSLEVIAGGISSTLSMLQDFPKLLLGGAAAWQVFGAAASSGLAQASGITEAGEGLMGGKGKDRSGMLGGLKDKASGMWGRMRGGPEAGPGGDLEYGSPSTPSDISDVGKDLADDLLEGEEKRDSLLTSGTVSRERTQDGGERRRESQRRRGFRDMSRTQMKIGATLIAAAAAWEAFKAYKQTRSNFEDRGFTKAQADRAGKTSAAGAGAGVIAGAALGTVVLGPAVGTAIGASLGAYVGPQLTKVITKQINSSMRPALAGLKEGLKINTEIEGSLGKQLDQWERISAVYKVNAELLSKQKSSLESQAAILTSLLVSSAEESSAAFGKVLTKISEELTLVEKYLEDTKRERGAILIDLDVNPKSFDTVEGFVKDLNRVRDEMNVKERGKSDAKNATGNVIKEKQLQAEIVSIQASRHVIEQEIANVLESQAKKVDLMNAYADTSVKQSSERLNAVMTMNNAIEGRLNMERELMDAAHFGMGASINMMQKQVDLAYENIRVHQKQISLQKTSIGNAATELSIYKSGSKDKKKSLELETRSTFSRMKGAKSERDRQRIFNEGVGSQLRGKEHADDRNKLQGALNKGLIKYNEYQKTSMEHQKKIYDLTKDIREGYLDALREMSFGFGEFEKIIGTQEMGVTQLMNTVRNVTGTFALNTMGAGGQELVDSEGHEARRKPVGGYRANAGGALVIDTAPGAERARNLGGAGGVGIYRHGESERTVRRQGMGIGAGPTAGTRGDVGTQMETLESVREGTEEGSERGARKGVYEGMADFWHTNQGVLDGSAPGMDARDMQAFANSITNFSMTLSDAGQGQVPVPASEQPIAGNRAVLPNPQEAEKTLRAWAEAQKSLMSMKPAQSRDIKFVKQYLAVTKAVVQNNETIARQKNIEAFTIDGISSRQLDNLKKQEVSHRKSVRSASNQEEVASRASAAAKDLTGHILKKELRLKRIQAIETNLTSLGTKQLQNIKAYNTAQSGRIADYKLADPSGTTYYGADPSYFGHGGETPSGTSAKLSPAPITEPKATKENKGKLKKLTREQAAYLGTATDSEGLEMMAKALGVEDKMIQAYEVNFNATNDLIQMRDQELEGYFSSGKSKALAGLFERQSITIGKIKAHLISSGREEVAVKKMTQKGGEYANKVIKWLEKDEENQKTFDDTLFLAFREMNASLGGDTDAIKGFMEALPSSDVRTELMQRINTRFFKKHQTKGLNRQPIVDKAPAYKALEVRLALSAEETEGESYIKQLGDAFDSFRTSKAQSYTDLWEVIQGDSKKEALFVKRASNIFGSMQTDSILSREQIEVSIKGLFSGLGLTKDQMAYKNPAKTIKRNQGTDPLRLERNKLQKKMEANSGRSTTKEDVTRGKRIGELDAIFAERKREAEEYRKIQDGQSEIVDDIIKAIGSEGSATSASKNAAQAVSTATNDITQAQKQTTEVMEVIAKQATEIAQVAQESAKAVIKIKPPKVDKKVDKGEQKFRKTMAAVLGHSDGSAKHPLQEALTFQQEIMQEALELGEKRRVKIRKDPVTGEMYNNAGRFGDKPNFPKKRSRSTPKVTNKQRFEAKKAEYRRLYDKALMKGQDVPEKYKDPDMVRDYSPEAKERKTREKQGGRGGSPQSRKRSNAIDNGPGVDNIKKSRLPDYMKVAGDDIQASFMSPETQSVREQIGISSALEGGGAGHAVVEVKLDPDLNAKVTASAELSVRLTHMTA